MIPSVEVWTRLAYSSIEIEIAKPLRLVLQQGGPTGMRGGSRGR